MSICQVDDCGRPGIKRGMCNRHYERERLAGRFRVVSKDPLVRLWSRVNKTETCWLWTAATTRGYGTAYWGGRMQPAHRVVYELLVGPIPEGLQLDHLCRVHGCVNPAHLEPVTIKTNVLRGTGFAAVHAAQNKCIHGHEFTDENTYRTAAGRHCRACRTAVSRKRSDRLVWEKGSRVFTRTCIECDGEFQCTEVRQRICSEECLKIRRRRSWQRYRAKVSPLRQ